jgi:2',3'-cyclic-nucleotide 2'-phosphodiesterase (5'-nucleotidase family)
MHIRIRFLLCLAVLAATQLSAEIRTLTILHTNDLHSRLSPLDNRHGGFAYVVSEIRHEREGCTDCILLNAGDLAQGSPVSTVYKGIPVFEIANMFGFDAATLGNHDFDYGWQQTKKFMEIAKYPIVSSNIVDSHNQLITSKPWVILKVNGLRVGVIGAMTDDLHTLTFPANLDDFHTTPSVETVSRYAKELKPQCDIVVVVGHINPDEEQALLREPDTPIVISGHTHSGLAHELSNGNHVLVRVKSYGEELGRLELKIDTEKKAPVSWTWKAILIDDAKITPAPDVAAQVKIWEDKVSTIVDKPIGTANHELSRRELKTLIEEMMKEKAGADFAFLNAGAVRDILPKGTILLRHVWNIMPFDNEIVWGTFKGRDLPSIVTAGKQIDPNKDYKLAVSDFTAANQNSQENLQTTGLKFPNDAGSVRDSLADFIRGRKVIE